MRSLILVNHPSIMIALARFIVIWAAYLVLVSVQSSNLLPGDSTELAWNSLPLDSEDSLWDLIDADSLWTSSDAAPLTDSNDLSTSIFDLSANQITPDIDAMSDTATFSNSDNLFASTLPDEVATLPVCDSKRSLPDNVLQARMPASCQTTEGQGTHHLPLQLFQDPVRYLRDKVRVPPTGQTSGGDPNRDDAAADEELPDSVFTEDLKRDQKRCPADRFGLSQTPVCSNPWTGWYDPTEPNGQIELFNVIPCMFSILQIWNFAF